MNTHHIIIRPIISEKSMKGAGAGKYTFAVAKHAGKTSIKQAIRTAFNVTVIGVATSYVKGKTKRTGKQRREVKVGEWKRAIVTVKKGEKIGLFEQGTDEKK